MHKPKLTFLALLLALLPAAAIAEDTSINSYPEILQRAQADDAYSQGVLSGMLRRGYGVAKDLDAAFGWAQKSASQDNPIGLYNLAVFYKNGSVVEADTSRSKALYEEAFAGMVALAESGDQIAQANLGWMYANGRGVEQNDAEAVRWYRKAAEQGYASAQYNLGWMYANGRGVEQNDAEAVRWYRKAAEQGYASAQYNLGWMYANGRGVEQNDAEAVKWYRKAAEQNHASAQYSLGWMYANGKGVGQDDDKAFEWWTLSAEQGNKYGQWGLCKAYREAIGVVPDKNQAMYWCRKSGKQGHSSAQEAYENLVNGSNKSSSTSTSSKSSSSTAVRQDPCSHVYAGKTFTYSGNLVSFTYVVLGYSSSTGRASIKDTRYGDTQEVSCSQIPR